MLVKKDDGVEVWPERNKVIGVTACTLAVLLGYWGLIALQTGGIFPGICALFMAAVFGIESKIMLKAPYKAMMINAKYIEFYNKNKTTTRIELDKIDTVTARWSYRHGGSVLVKYTENDGKKCKAYLYLKTAADGKLLKSAIREYIDEAKIKN